MNFAFIITPNKQLHFWQPSRNPKFMVPESLINPQIRNREMRFCWKSLKIAMYLYKWTYLKRNFRFSKKSMMQNVENQFQSIMINFFLAF